MKITYYEHSAVVIGYDQNFVYVNDPLKIIHVWLFREQNLRKLGSKWENKQLLFYNNEKVIFGMAFSFGLLTLKIQKIILKVNDSRYNNI